MTEGIPTWPDIAAPLFGRSHDFDTAVTPVEMESGRKRTRRNALTPRETIQITCNFTVDEYATFEEFFITDLANGAGSFLLVTFEPSALAEYQKRVSREVAFMAPYSFDKSDNLFAVSGELEVKDVVIEIIPIIDPVGAELERLKFFNGPVYCIAPYGNNQLYVSGRFTQYGNDAEGWNDCLGICRLLKTGELDATFAPGGVVGGGFDISGGFFAPSQMQFTEDGGVFVGNSYVFLHERLLYIARGQSSRYNSLSLNGEEVPPVIKLGPTGIRDTTFNPTFLQGVATTEVFQSFHMFEHANAHYYTYQRNIIATTPGGDSATYSGDDFCVLEARRKNGDLIRRAYRASSLGLGSADFQHQVFIEVSVAGGYVVWTGHRGNLNDNGALCLSVGASETQVVPVNYKMAELRNNAVVGALGFDLGLNFGDALNWDGYTRNVVDTERFKTFAIGYIDRGCFRGSFVGSFSVDPDGLPGEGRWTGGPDYQHKGAWHYHIPTGFGPFWFIERSGTVKVQNEYGTLPPMDGYYAMAFSEDDYDFDVTENPDEPEERFVSGFNAGVWNEEFSRDFAGGKIKLNMAGGPEEDGTIYDWIIYGPAYRFRQAGPSNLWDLRGAGDPDNPHDHGFGIFAGGYTDYDGSQNVRVLTSLRDELYEQANGATSNTLGIFFTGMIEKFKGVTKFTRDGQIAKIRHDGEFDATFACPLMGPATMPIKANVDTGAIENLHNKVTCAALSANGTRLYVGGRFTDVGGRECGHIVVLNVNTGAVILP